MRWFTLGSLATSSLSFISIPIIAWVFNDVDIGKAALLISTGGLCTILFSLGLDQGYSREFNETPDHVALLLNSMVPGFTLFTAVAVLVLAFQSTWLSWVLFGQHSLALSLFVVGYLFIVLVSRFLSLSHRMREDGKRYALSFLVSKITFVALICLAYVKSGSGLFELLLAHGASVSVGLIYLLATTHTLWSRMRPSLIDRKLLSKLLAFGLPMAAGGLLFWGLEGVDKFMLRSLSSFSELGVYSIALSISAIANVATSMFTTIWIPVVYRWVANTEDLSRIDQVSQHILAAVVFLIGAAGASSWLLEFALPEQYRVVQYLIPACMLWPLFYALSETTGLGIAITRSSHSGLVLAAVSLAVNVGLNLVLLPRLGSIGAVVSLAVSIWVFMALRTEVSYRIWRQMPRQCLYTWTLAALVLSCAHALFGSAARAPMLAFWLAFLSIACIAFRSSIEQARALILAQLCRRRNQSSC
ncbi:lipopolysaccharide biosynthesis protein [Pseudomonas sp. LS44]|uniref:lipopolysaccharide biosynthesis protein n=1 Tax=Pseudomonas sp. LS44 TaxID=1357074 RepID=UPI00215B6000|nr:lipopolysaccharide biosynthesis protein [Pseudomonas sp. LS44]UVE19034.1 lipopolysaccharide biosynthesis protein [Pseudomonas sp. LS44]